MGSEVGGWHLWDGSVIGTCCTAERQASRFGCQGIGRWSLLDSRRCSSAGRRLSSTAEKDGSTKLQGFFTETNKHVLVS